MLCTLYLSPLCTLFSRKLKFLSLQENRSHFCLWWHIIVIFFCVCVFLFFFPSLTLAVKFQQLVVLCYVLDSVLKSAALKLRCQKCSTNFKINHDSFATVKNLLDCFTNPTPDFSVCFLFHCSRTNTELFRLDILYLAAWQFCMS